MTVWDDADAQGLEWKPAAPAARVTADKALADAAGLPDAFRPIPLEGDRG